MKRLVRGPRAVLDAITSAPARIAMILIDQNEDRALGQVTRTARRKGIEVQRRPSAELDALCPSQAHEGVIAITGDYSYVDLDRLVAVAREREPEPLIVALDSVQDVHNVGALLRSIIAFGAGGLILCRHGGAPVTAAAVRVSMGASEHTAVTRVTNLANTLAELDELEFNIIGLDPTAKTALAEADLKGPTVVVLGSEAKGMRRLVRKKCNDLYSLPRLGPLDSLNVAVAGAVTLYEARRQREFGS